ncbi:capsid cement protein [Bilophila wadsworthia]|uniref:capsid cement protein n=1 Tax=Bilophila wadsworthia TaxID=35833 RepID=UPI0026DB1EC2|nr:capsid cement protein [Bilophila wadsworthia]
MATPGVYKNFEAEGEIGPYVIVTHGTADYAVKAATGATVALVGTTDELGKLSNGRVDVCTGGIPEVALGGTVAAGDPLTSDASGKAVKATAAGNRILGFALVSGASGDIIPYQYSLGTLAVAAAG